MPLWFNYERPLGALMPRPVVPVTVVGPTRSQTVHAVLDSGADVSLFETWLADSVGIDLKKDGTAGAISGINGTLNVVYAEVLLELTDGNQQVDWRTIVAFTGEQIREPGLGFAGALQYFDTTFFGRKQQARLVWNHSYRGPKRRRPRAD